MSVLMSICWLASIVVFLNLLGMIVGSLVSGFTSHALVFSFLAVLFYSLTVYFWRRF